MKRIVLLGSTGSIGESTLSVVEALPEEFELAGIAVNSNYQEALKQAEKFNVKHVAVADKECALQCEKEASNGVTVYAGIEGVEEVATLGDADIVLCAIVGMAGLKPVLAAVRKGVDVALATKEVLVAGGSIVMDECARSGARLIPVDSEHSAIFQCLNGSKGGDIKKLILTASGGPFSAREDLDLAKVTVAEALNHPNWDMGKKVTIDSATLMNKGLEVMEARWMFDCQVDKIDVVLHPESIVHSFVEFVDGNTLAQLSIPDMRYAIQYALSYPNRLDGGLRGLDLAGLNALHFSSPDTNRFPCLDLAFEAARSGGTLPAVLNAANEIAVERFLDEDISFPGIWSVVEAVMKKHTVVSNPGIDDIINADINARSEAKEV